MGAQKLVRQRRVMRGKGKENFSVLVLTKEGKLLAKQQHDSSPQQLYAGFVKPQEIAHDAALYRMYQVEAAEIEKRGGTIRRVVLYADRHSASRLNAALSYGRGSTYDGPELTAKIPSL